MKSLTKRAKQLIKNKKARPLLVIGVIALVGGLVLTLTHASGFFVSLEPEVGVNSPAAAQSDSNASGGEYVRFGAESVPNTSGRGPTKQWPNGFPAYDTPADITTNGSLASLQSALNSLGSTGGVIEHPGNIPEVDLDRPEGPAIVIRPPIGKRSDYTSAGNPRHSNMLLAGWKTTNMTLNGGTNSYIRNAGWAWCEATKNAGINVFGNYSDVEGIFYEIVFREFGQGNTDRGGIRSYGSNARAVQTIVGSILTGGLDPDPAHSDTLQTYYSNGSWGKIYARDSIIWGSYDKNYQGVSSSPAEFDNVYMISPQYTPQAYQGPSNVSSLVKGTTTAGAAIFRNSTFVGQNNPNQTIQVSNSEFYGTDLSKNIDDQGGNKVLSSLPIPPPAPTHEQLDTIWSP